MIEVKWYNRNMLQRLKNFIFYNNGFVVILLLVVLSSGSVMAANPNVRDGVVSSEDKLIKVDNSYIRDVNLENHDFDIKITKVEKDEENYYLSYEFKTIELVDGSWKKIVKRDILTINIEQLGNRDLGLYAAEQLKQLVDQTKNFLTEVQISENTKGATNKTVARNYKGLVGRFLESDEITFAGYDPVVEPPVIIETDPEENLPQALEEIPVEDVIEEPDIDDDNDNDNATTTDPIATTSDPVLTSDTTAPVLNLIGEALLELTVGELYVEPGATATDDINGDVTAYIVVSGAVNTDAPGTYTVTYSVSDAVGNISSLAREVRVIETVPEVVPETEPEVEPANSSTSPEV